MATRKEIQINFDKANQEIRNLRAAADDLENTGKIKMLETLNNISLSWKGDNAAAFIDKGKSVEEKLVATARELRVIANCMETTVRNIYTAEMKSLMTASRRDY